MAQNGPGKTHRTGINVMRLAQMFPNDESAMKWFEAVRWANGRYCPRCGPHAHERSQSQDDALLVRTVPQVLQRQDRYRHAVKPSSGTRSGCSAST